MPPAFRPPILRSADWSKIAALVLAPGVPLTHPAPHWSVQLAQQAGVEMIGDIELFCRERAKPRARMRPSSPSPAPTANRRRRRLIAHLVGVGRHGRAARRQYRHGDPVAPPPPRVQPLRVHVIECSSYQIDLAPSLDPSVGILINLSEDHLDRHGTMEHYAAVKERLVAGVPPQGTAIVGIDDEWCRAIADRLAQSGKRVVRISVRQALADGVYVDGERIVRAGAGAATPIADARRHRLAARPAQRAECRLRCRGGAGARAFAGGDPGRARSFPGPGASHGGSRPPRQRAVRQRFQSDQCQFRPRRRWPASAISTGSPAASRRPAASNRCARFSRASARPI